MISAKSSRKPDGTTPAPASSEREALLESERDANKAQARNFKEDALRDKVVSIEPDGTGPSSTRTMDADNDQARGSGNETDADDRGIRKDTPKRG